MKTKISTQKENKEFTPFKIEFLVETIQDARLMFHLANEDDHKDFILDTIDFNSHNYSHDFSDEICAGDSLWRQIEDEIEAQGFEL